MYESIEIAKRLPENRGPRQSVIDKALRSLATAGVKDPGIELVLELITPVLRVEPLSEEASQAELEAQVVRYQEFGFPQRLGMLSGRFKDTVMRLAVPQSKIYRGRFDIPVVVIGTQIPVAEQYRMIGVDYYLDDSTTQATDPQGYKTPRVPHLFWMQDGTRYLNKSVDTVTSSYVIFERGANIHDGVGLVVARPNILKDHFVDLPGTQLGPDLPGTQLGPGTVAYLAVRDGRPEVNRDFTNTAGPKFGSASGGV
jgi:hypothetical protein